MQRCDAGKSCGALTLGCTWALHAAASTLPLSACQTRRGIICGPIPGASLRSITIHPSRQGASVAVAALPAHVVVSAHRLRFYFCARAPATLAGGRSESCPIHPVHTRHPLLPRAMLISAVHIPDTRLARPALAAPPLRSYFGNPLQAAHRVGHDHGGRGAGCGVPHRCG